MYQAIYNSIFETLNRNFFTISLVVIIYLAIVAAMAVVFMIVAGTFNSAIKSGAKKRTIKKGCESISKRKLIRSSTLFVFFALMATLASGGTATAAALYKIGVIGSIVMLMIVFGKMLDVVVDLYSLREISKKRPIKGPIQVVKIVIYIVMGLILIATLINQNPIVLISGIGAFTAILSIVFKDALLGLVAGVQITSENLLRIGDWISIPSLGVEGAVTDIQLISVKVKAYDNTAYTIPAYTFLSVPFKNHNEAINNQARQLSRTVYVNAEDVKFSGDKTNLTEYREALEAMLRSNEHVKQNFSLVVRTGSSSNGYGIPVEIFATVDITNYDEFCNFVSEIEEKTIALMNQHDLRPYQAKS